MPADLFSQNGLKKRLRLVQLALNDRGAWYRWGGNVLLTGIDCSAFVIKELKCVGSLPGYYDGTTRDLYELYKRYVIKEPFVGCLVFYGKPRIVHVMICLDDMFAIGAINGGPNCKTVEDAIKYNAFVEVRPIAYREDIHAIVDPFQEG